MSERTTAEIMARLRNLIAGGWTIGDLGETDRVREAADRLEELDALRPPCPTCARWANEPRDELNPCPDCSDGRVSWERLAQVFTAVHAEQAHDDVPAAILAYLRGIR